LGKINQQDNYQANFGFCLRSSSIFYIPPSPVKTSIVFSNYWKFKNNLEVFLIANFRNMEGKLIKREKVIFDNKTVVELEIRDGFSGSCEIESFSNKDLRIPYSAIMIVYESAESISMVHSYSRIYSQIELEDRKVICEGKEGCWTLRDNEEIESFAVIHNGSNFLQAQEIEFSVTNHKGEKKKINYHMRSLKPYETFVVYPNLIFKNLSNFLEGKEGSGLIHFQLSTSFSRLLVGWQTKNKKELQVTHSNFDYSSHQTDLIDCEYNFGHMMVPKIDNNNKDVYTIIYPDKSPGKYAISSEIIKKRKVKNILDVFQTNPQDLRFQREDGKLPSRIVTAIKIKSKNSNNLPCECSLGIMHKMCPKKRFHWGLISKKFKSKIIITAVKNIFGVPFNSNICLKIYSQKTDKIIENNLNWEDISKDGVNGTIDINNYFNEADIDNDKFMYVSFFSQYPGFFAYTTLEKGNSFSLEHTF